MSRLNSSGQTSRQVLVNSVGFERFAFLFNGCIGPSSVFPTKTEAFLQWEQQRTEPCATSPTFVNALLSTLYCPTASRQRRSHVASYFKGKAVVASAFWRSKVLRCFRISTIKRAMVRNRIQFFIQYWSMDNIGLPPTALRLPKGRKTNS